MSNSLQESTKNVDILAALLSDHSPVFLNLTKCENIHKGNGFWKFNNSLLFHEEFKIMLKDHISNTIMFLETETSLNFRSKWEFLKYEIRKFSMKYSKTLKKNETIRKNLLEANLKDFETKLTNDENISLYNNFKKELEEIYDKIVEGNKVRSRCQWYEEGEKSNKFFLNLEKKRGAQGMISKILIDNAETLLWLTTSFRHSQVQLTTITLILLILLLPRSLKVLERRTFKGYIVCIYLSSPGLALNIMSKQGSLSLASILG